jgi:hypothetical protein
MMQTKTSWATHPIFDQKERTTFAMRSHDNGQSQLPAEQRADVS